MSAIFWTGLSFLLLLAAPGGRRHPRLIGLAALLFGLVGLLLSLPFWYPPLKLGLHYNWTGKLLSIVVFLVLIYGFRVVSPAEAGLRRPAPGSLRWVLPVVLGLAALGFTAGFLERHSQAGASPGWEDNLYQLTMPGLEEELFFRGVWLGLLARVFPRTLPLPGTRTSWGGVVGLVLFVLVHVLSFDQGPRQWLPTVHFAWGNVAGVALLGTLFLWVRERTGSTLAAAATHNLMNVAQTLALTLP